LKSNDIYQNNISFDIIKINILNKKKKKKRKDVDKIKNSMLESSSVYIGLKCGWNGISKQGNNKNNLDQSILEEQSILLSGPYGDDVAFIKQTNDQIIIGKEKLFKINK
jgi:hypothetical protein